MKKKALLCLLLPLLLAGCERNSFAVLARTEILPEAGAAAAETSVTAATANTNSEAITEILEYTLHMQPCSAGDSLRLAALAGKLLCWQTAHPGGSGEARRSALAWAGKHSASERSKAAGVLRLLHSAAQRMDSRELLSLLLDAGVELRLEESDRDGFMRLAESLSRALEGEIFKKSTEIMNISR